MTSDTYDAERKAMIEAGGPQQDLVEEMLVDGPTWTTSEMTAEFEVLGFAAPFVVVRRRDTGERGSLEFVHSPRVYFGWKPE